MADPSLFDFMRLPSDALIALDNRPLHFAMQPWHYLLRMVHVVCMGAFFGGILVLDLKLMGWHRAAPPRLFAEAILPWLYWVFGALVVTGGLLFAYDPVHVGSHAYFTPKLALTALGLGNALLFHRTGYLAPAAQPVGQRRAHESPARCHSRSGRRSWCAVA